MLKLNSCACDIPSHAYQYSWNPNPRWSQLYAGATEILEYLKSTVTKFDLRRYIQFNTTCKAAIWDEKNSEWIVSLQRHGMHIDEITVKCDVFIMATGRLNNWKFPNIEGLDTFQGSLIHTANWPQALDYHGKDIAVIGNGASSTQCLARLSQGMTRTPRLPFLTNINRRGIYWQLRPWTNISSPARVFCQWRSAGHL